MKKLLLTVVLVLFSTLAFAQIEGEPEFTDNEVLLLRAAKPLYQERETLRQETTDQLTAVEALASLDAKIAQVTTIRDNWEAAGRTGAVLVANLVLDTLAADRVLLAERVANPVDHAARIAELSSILSQFLQVLLPLAPEGRTTASYIEFVS